MALGLGVLALAPAVLWSMTVRELEAAVRGRLGSIGRERPMSRREMQDLMGRYPDTGPASGSCLE